MADTAAKKLQDVEQSSHNEVQSLKTRLEQVDQAMATLKVRAKQKISDLQAQVDQLQKERTEANDSTSKPPPLMSPLDRPDSAQPALDSETSRELEALRQKSEKERQEFETRLADRDREIAELKASAERSAAEKQVIDSKYQQTEEQVGSLKRECEHLKEENAKLASATRTVDPAKPEDSDARIKELEESAAKQMSVLEEQIKAKDEKISKLSTVVEKLVRTNKELGHQVSEVKQKSQQGDSDELQKVQSELDRVKLDAEKEKQEALNKLKSELDAKVEELNKKILELETRPPEIIDAPKETAAPTTAVDTDRLAELEKRNFTLEEQVKDFKFQISSRQSELTKAQEMLVKVKQENEQMNAANEEKLKKIKGLFAVANKNINEQRELVSKKDTELTELQSQVEQLKHELETAKLSVESYQHDIKRLSLELADQGTLSVSKTAELQQQFNAATDELNQVKLEYQNYKLRAHALLQQKTDDAATRKVASLEAEVDHLTKERNELSQSAERSKQKIRELESELYEALERVTELESQMDGVNRLEQQRNQLEQKLNTMQHELSAERSSFELKLKMKDSEIADMLEKNKKEFVAERERIETRLTEKENELESLQQITEDLNEQLSQARSEVLKFKDEVSQTKRQLDDYMSNPTSPVQMANGSSNGGSKRNSNTSVVVPLHNLLKNDGGSGSLADLNTSRIRELELQLQEMTEVLADSETRVQQLLDQERILKEEIRNIDRQDRRTHLNMEYLKNIIMKFASTPNQALVPVLSQVLLLNPEESKELRETIQKRESSFW